MPTQMLSVAIAADALGISIWTLRRWCYDGRCASHKMGTRLLVSAEEVERIQRESERPRLSARASPRLSVTVAA